MRIARLEPVPLRTLQPNEARDLTTWLRENLERRLTAGVKSQPQNP